MRKQFVETLSDLFVSNDRMFLMLGDIGVHGFRALLDKYPQRAINFGILEQAMIGAAAGISSEDYIPVVHTIAPFMVERAYEQIKIDLGYQKLGANLVSVGGSFDYAGLGCTHHCPADVSLVCNIPGARVFLPGTASEFDTLFRSFYRSGLNYFRLSEEVHEYGSLPTGVSVIEAGRAPQAATIFVGPALRFFDRSQTPTSHAILYLNVISDDINLILPSGISSCNIIQDFYCGPVEQMVRRHNKDVAIRTLAPERRFLESYGTRSEAYSSAGLSRAKIIEFLKNE